MLCPQLAAMLNTRNTLATTTLFAVVLVLFYYHYHYYRRRHRHHHHYHKYLSLSLSLYITIIITIVIVIIIIIIYPLLLQHFVKLLLLFTHTNLYTWRGGERRYKSQVACPRTERTNLAQGSSTLTKTGQSALQSPIVLLHFSYYLAIELRILGQSYRDF